MNALKKLPPPRMGIPEFLDRADRRPGRWQLRDGAPEAMAPPTERQGAIQSELAGLIRDHFRRIGSRCGGIITPGVVPRLRSDRNMLVPDIAISRAPPSSRVALRDPIVLIEIIFPSNEARTRANVWANATIPGVSEIVLVSSLDIAAEILLRLPDGRWPEVPEMIGRNGRLTIERIGFDAPLIDVYATTDLV
jgi:Uma2 family endonuclease